MLIKIRRIFNWLFKNDLMLMVYSRFETTSGYIKATPRIEQSSSVSTWNYFTLQVEKLLNSLHPRYYAASAVARRAFSPIGHVIAPYKRNLSSEDFSSCAAFANLIANNFSFIDYSTSLGFVTSWASIREEGFSETGNDCTDPELIIEFGSGLGIHPLMVSTKYPKSHVLLYDLPEMIALQKNVHSYLQKQAGPVDLSRIDYLDKVDDLYKTIKSFRKNSKIDFYAFWSFSEAPLKLRDEFCDILKSCNRVLIVSNPEIFCLNNEDYFSNLSLTLKSTHNYFKKALPLSKTSFLSKHACHVFIKK